MSDELGDEHYRLCCLDCEFEEIVGPDSWGEHADESPKEMAETMKENHEYSNRHAVELKRIDDE